VIASTPPRNVSQNLSALADCGNLQDKPTIATASLSGFEACLVNEFDALAVSAWSEPPLVNIRAIRATPMFKQRSQCDAPERPGSANARHATWPSAHH
jgi:hypothetical protein